MVNKSVEAATELCIIVPRAPVGELIEYPRDFRVGDTEALIDGEVTNVDRESSLFIES